MDQHRRTFLSLSVLTPFIALLPFSTVPAAQMARAQSGRVFQKEEPSPLPEDALATPAPVNADPKILLEYRQQEMKQDVDKLYALVQKLKEQTDRTDSASVLSLNVVQSAKKVESLAKQIRNLARK